MLRQPCLPVLARALDGARITLPQSVRLALGSQAAVSAEPSGSILIASPRLWAQVLPQLQRQAAATHHAAELFRLLAASESTVRVDVRGRLTVPPLLMEWAGLCPGHDAVLVVIGGAIQVWDPGRLSRLLRLANQMLRSLSTHILREQLPLVEEVGTDD